MTWLLKGAVFFNSIKTYINSVCTKKHTQHLIRFKNATVTPKQINTKYIFSKGILKKHFLNENGKS